MAQSYWREKFHTLRNQSPPPLAGIPTQEETIDSDRTAHTRYPSTSSEDILGEHAERGRDTRPRKVLGAVPPLSPVLSPSFAFPSAVSATAPGTATGTDVFPVQRGRRSRTISHPIRRPSTADGIDPALTAGTSIPESVSVTDIPVSQAKPDLPYILEDKTWIKEHNRVVPDLSHPEQERIKIPNYSAPLSSLEVLEKPHNPGTQARMEAFAVSNPLLPPVATSTQTKGGKTTDAIGARRISSSMSPRQPYYRERSFSDTAIPDVQMLPKGTTKQFPFFYFGPPSTSSTSSVPPKRGTRDITAVQRSGVPPSSSSSSSPSGVHRRSQSAGIPSLESDPLSRVSVPKVGMPKKKDIDPAMVTDEISGVTWDELTERIARMQ